ncbi:MAG: GNAT family N-acetyltransferase [Alphaproteobacteria bacterium]|nr:GNAT family N-acetyltransferase [Alphaproteobacteria bacterium]
MTSLPTWNVRDKTEDDQTWIEDLLSSRWGSPIIVVHGERFDATALPALVVDGRYGLATCKIAEVAELITLDAVTTGQGIGTALIKELSIRLKHQGIGQLWVTTTNDNIGALRFYQQQGFRIRRIRSNAVDQARHIKPSIPLIGRHGIPIRDEIELAMDLDEIG